MTEKLDRQNLRANPNRTLCLLDAAGYLPAPGETQDQFLSRAEREFFAPAKVEFMEKSKEFQEAKPIPEKIRHEGGDRTESLYGFRNKRVPGYFLGHGFGFLFGGCSVTEEESGETAIILRKEFAKRGHWFLYDRAELLAHEQCHGTRAILKDEVYDEYFAYATSSLKYRQYIGGCFNHESDPLLFLSGFLLLILAEIAAFLGYLDYGLLKYFLIVALLPVLYLALRNHLTWRRVKLAEKHLNGIGIAMAKACLFRATAEEISEISHKTGKDLESYLSTLKDRELRWKIALMRFGCKTGE